MASQARLEEAYYRYKSMGIKRQITQELCNDFGVSRTTMYKWAKSKITIDGVTYDNWEAAIKAENTVIRKQYEEEINNELKDGWRLLDLVETELLKKYLIQVKDENYQVKLDELEKIINLAEKVHTRIEGVNPSDSENNSGTVVNVNMGYVNKQGDKVE